MNLREPKKKRRVKFKPQAPFPIFLGESSEWAVYTAHLTDLGSCIVDPNEIAAVHSMGFFGKGSLSRSYPSFGKTRYGAPPVVRNRQWARRQEWLTQFNELSTESREPNIKDVESEENIKVHSETERSCEILQEQTAAEDITEENEIMSKCQDKESTSDIIEIHETLSPTNKNLDENMSTEEKVEEDVILDSTEEDDVCVILHRDIEKESDKNLTACTLESSNNDVEEFYNFDNCNFEKDSCFQNNDSDLQSQLLVLPDSDTENENYLKEINPRIECESFPIQETLHLTFEETFFLLYGLGCLNLINFDGGLLDINSAWLYFCKADQNFIKKYVVYHYFRSKGWVVKPGLKYGGDFLLYKQGPPFYHASYIVIIDILNADTLIRDPNRSMRNLTWNNLLGLERLSETASKEILFAQVLWPSSISSNNPSDPDVLSEFSVRELLWRRWNPKHNKEVIDLEEEDEESC